MTTILASFEVVDWLQACLGTQNCVLLEAITIRSGSGCQVWQCHFVADGLDRFALLKVYPPDLVSSTQLNPLDLAQKCILAAQELSSKGVSIPALIGHAIHDRAAAVLMEQLVPTAWRSETRLQAATILARLHTITITQLSDHLRHLIKTSAPNRYRVLRGVEAMVDKLNAAKPAWPQDFPSLYEKVQTVLTTPEPVGSTTTLVHGDYFSVNIIPTIDALYIIDWDLLALGDPIWDLGFLIGADQGLAMEEVTATVAAYEQWRPVDTVALTWHQRCWSTFWQLRHLLKAVDA